MIRKTLVAAGLAASMALSMPAGAMEPTLTKIKQSGSISLGYRENSIPFSFVGDDKKKARGYSIDLCEAVVADLANQLMMPKLEVKWVPLTAQNRFDAVKKGEVDLECGNTTQTLSRRAEFDFSLMTFVDGAGLLYRAGEKPKSLAEIKDQRVAVVVGTTTEKTLDALVNAAKLGVRLIKVKDHDTAISALMDKTATAYAADRTVLITTALVRGKGEAFELGEEQFSFEPYGLMMRRDADFRLAVDRTLAQLYRSGEIGAILKRWFEPLGSPGEGVKMMFMLNALPE
ncbi:MAG: amino acid ABC transporter substrate-binding protein [Zoogloeaceae bacterium]|nr:amino acid ABC transporter substrate-binding protein [Zoogloeaceae bacterium]